MIKLRVQGLPDEVKAFSQQMRTSFRVLEESSSYPNRNSEYVRVYMDIEVEGGSKGGDYKPNQTA